MTARRVTLLFAIGIVIIALAAWVSSRNQTGDDSVAGTAVLPGLRGSLNDVTQVRITKAGNARTTLDRKATDWLVGERGYPADSGKLRKLLLDLGSLKAVERKTSIARNYAVLGVDDVTAPKATRRPHRHRIAGQDLVAHRRPVHGRRRRLCARGRLRLRACSPARSSWSMRTRSSGSIPPSSTSPRPA